MDVNSDYNLLFFANGKPVPALLTEVELIQFLRIPEVSSAANYHSVVKNLIRFKDLPRIQICKKLLFPKKAVLEWIEEQTVKN